MKKIFLALTVSAFIFFAFAAFSLAGDDANAKKNQKPQTEPLRTFELIQAFKKGLSFEMEVKTSLYTQIQGISLDQKYNLKMNAKITEIKDKKASKIEFTNIHGTFEQNSDLGQNSQEEETNIKQIKDASIKGELTKQYLLKNYKRKNINKDFLGFFPFGPVSGFVAPDKSVKIGESWSSGKLIPLGPVALESTNTNIDRVKGSFQLVKVEKDTKSKKEIAYIFWTGSARLSGDTGENGTIKWKRTIKFDLSIKQVIENSGSAKLEVSMAPGVNYSVSIKGSCKCKFKAADKPPADKPKDIPNKPKDDE